MWDPLENAINRIGGTFDLLILTAFVLVFAKTGGDIGLLPALSKTADQLMNLLKSDATQVNIILISALAVIYLIKDLVVGLIKSGIQAILVLLIALVIIDMGTSIDIIQHLIQII